MAASKTPLGFQTPASNELVRNGADEISANALKSDELFTDTRGRVGSLEAGKALDPGLVEDPDNPGTYFLEPDTNLAPDPVNPGFYLLPAVDASPRRIVSIGADGILPENVTLWGGAPVGGGGGAAFPEGPLPTTSLTAGTNLIVRKVNGVWPARPTSRADVVVTWVGADPDPAIVSSGTGGALNNVDLRMWF